MKAADVMTRDVVTVKADAPIAEAVRLMLDRRISGLPVVDAAGRLIGIVTEGDFLRRAETGTEKRRPRWVEFLVGPGRLAEDYVRTHARKVAEVMTAKVATANKDADVTDIVRLMEQRRIKRVPIVEDDRIVGLVSRADLLHALGRLMAQAPAAPADDAALRERILAEFERQNWVPLAGIDVKVSGGEVVLSGAITDERERQALRVAVENIAGVKAVHDRLAWVEPTSGWVMDAPDDEAAAR